ncbi:hypothetical protein CERSUDRAFT_122740 [Gelatoporia subvermispora B]|uniref:Uncharacterized protein n=1 Tax=Ceriporiopsis subvermispora (strain B) TaxID=914234 RepID=M2RKK0_CERS8|nr:hypothetical protein CERSUDRAFT_122740 [Gelatoporia subvermispora B]
MRSELLGNVLESFWWLHACGVAHHFELPLERLVLVSSMSFSCDISTDPITDTNDYPIRLPRSDTYYFHQLALMESGEMPSPFGYWSLDAGSSPGPWPEISIAGVELRCWYGHSFVPSGVTHGAYPLRQEVRYSYLSPMQAQLVGYFWDCLQAAGPQLSFSQPHMTEIHAELDRDDDKRSKLYATYVDGVDEEGYGDPDSTSSECEFADEDAGTK